MTKDGDGEAALVFDRALLATRRDRAAQWVDQHAFLMDRVAEDLAERLSIVRREFPAVLDLGAAHGAVGRALAALGSVGTIISADLSRRLMDRIGGSLRVVADEEALPFRDGSLDLVVSGLSLHAVNDLPGTLVQIRRAMKPDGLLLAALLGGMTLHELREAWLMAEAQVEGGASPRVAPFADVRELGGLLQRAGFALPVVDSDVVRVAYATPFDLMRDIKAMGCSNALRQRRRVPTRRATLMRAAELYAERYARADGRVEATFEIVTLTAWVPHESQQQPMRPGSARMRLADALGVEEHIVKPDTAE